MPRSPTVLVVDDDQDYGDALCALLQSGGRQAIGALSGREALALLRAGLQPDAVLLDLNLGDMSGERFLAEMRRSAPYARVPVVLMSGSHEVREVAERHPEVAGVLPKPPSPERLEEELKRIEPGMPVTSRFRTLEREAEGSAESAPDESRLLSDASELLTQSVDPTRAIDPVLDLFVPSLAEWAIVEALDDDGALRAIAHRHGEESPALERLIERGAGRGCVDVIPDAIRDGSACMLRDLDEASLESLAWDAAQAEALRALGTRSLLILPLMARGRVLGALTLANPGRGEAPSREQVDTAKDLARDLALGLDSARLFGQLRRAVRAREDLLAIVSHDLRNPLSTVRLTATKIMEADDYTDEERRSDAERILRACRQMDLLVRDLLDFSQLESGRMRLRPRPIALDEILERALEQARALSPDQPIELDAAGTSEVEARCDPERILQALGNLLANAVRFSPAEAPIRLRARVVGDEARISVEDRGPGISEEDQGRLFEPYRQARHGEARGGAQGVGLGLYIAKNVMEAHGGWISVESELGRGSVFTLGLPLGEGGSEEAA